MKSPQRAALYGAAIGATLGFLSSILGNPPADGLYVPQTSAGVLAGHIGYAIPWATVGGLIGYAVGRRRTSIDPSQPARVAEAPPVATNALQRLGHVLGWTGNVIALPLIALGLYGFSQAAGDAFVKGAAIGLGVIAFLIGRALRYILAGSFR